jgi:Protein of unknown function (DUF3592)
MAAKLKNGFYLWAVALVVSVLFLGLSIQIIRDAARAGEWPVVEGRIISSKYVLGCGRSGRDPFPEVRYDYFHQGKRYTGSRIALDTDFCGWASPARAIAESYQAGQKIPVRVDPTDPQKSVLRAGDPQPQSIGLLIASFAGLVLASYKVFHRVRGAA